MNAGRFVGASVAVFVVRTLLNYLFYGYLMHPRMEAMSAAHPGMFREVVPAFITLDLLAALLITWLVIKAGAAFGGGVKGGLILGILVALLSPVLSNLYYYFSTTYYAQDLLAIESIYQIITHAVQGALAAMIYKTA
ncbi:MAG TPA: hypothetical protein VH394_09940 [Thermoanaerobaculia bacterium]|jgi:uncharacterized membrane protein (DUF485 family)|nr:hypothetical protein [Thermoanaerobaculia bacterium]